MANLHLVTGYAGQAHITAEDHGSLNAALTNGGNYVLSRGNKFAASAITSNQVRVLDGDLLLQGRHVRLAESTYVDLTIDSGAQGMYRNDLIVARYTKNSSSGIEECNLVVIKGTAVSSDPADPAYSDGDLLNDHVAQADFPLYRVTLNGLSVSLEQLFEVVMFVTVGADGKINSELLPPSMTLSSSVSSTSTTTAANSYAVKQAYDKADTAQSVASSAKTTAAAAIPKTQRGAANGVATLDANGKVTASQVDNLNTFYVSSSSAVSVSENNNFWFDIGHMRIVVFDFSAVVSSAFTGSVGFSVPSIFSGYTFADKKRTTGHVYGTINNAIQTILCSVSIDEDGDFVSFNTATDCGYAAQSEIKFGATLIFKKKW